MGVLGIVPFLLKKCPTLVENIPNRFQALQGKTIALDGTLITQRIFYNPDPRPHRHVLGWYQLIQELRQNNINVVCVFDGKHRIPAKRVEVERRRLLRVQAQARGVWEKSRHERLLSLTETLRRLEVLPTENQQEVLKTLQVSPGFIPFAKEDPPNTVGSDLASDLTDISQSYGDTTGHLGQVPSADASPLTSGSLSLQGTNTDPSVPEPAQTIETGPLNEELSTTGRLSGSEQGVEIDQARAPGSIDGASHADRSALEETAEDAPPTAPDTEIPLSKPTSKIKDMEDHDMLKPDVQEAPPESSKDPSSDQYRTSLDGAVTESDMENFSELGSITEDKLSPQSTEAKLRINSLKIEDSKILTHKILDLFDHYNRTTASGPDGRIPALGLTANIQDAPIIPISRVQLKYTQEETELWKQLARTSDNTTMDLSRVVEMVEQFASVELPNDEFPTDEVAVEEEVEPPISERSAKLEEQSSLMAASYERRANPPTALTYAEARLILEAMGVPCIQSSLPYEAEALACSLVLNGLADFVGSEDTDVLLYNAPLLRNMTNRKVPLQIIPSSVETNLGLTRTAFVDAAILMGTDFVKRLGGIGPATAWRLMHQYGSIEVMLEKEPKFRPVDVAEYLEQVRVARIIFGTIPPAPAAEDVKPGHWDEQAVYDVMSRFELLRYLDEDQVISNALSANYYDNDSETKPFQ
ncbi:hypothetical protein OPQ81_006760 [Rhizoctonia solani]|nr:hypothetical protein OPQ81_006760 [Rhizoctonia solani]